MGNSCSGFTVYTVNDVPEDESPVVAVQVNRPGTMTHNARRNTTRRVSSVREVREQVQGAKAKSEHDETWTQDNVNNNLEKLMRSMQLHNLKRLKEEIDHDVNTFILNNLLMSVQFFGNFQRAKDAADQYKRTKEAEMNEKLADMGALEGMILGERRCHLLNGMGHILAKNYIYKSPEGSCEEEFYGNYYYGSDPKNTFMSGGILPLEFQMTWDNLEMYPSSAWDMLHTMTYSSAKGIPPIWRFCMEEPDETHDIPRGYVRLRSVDVTGDIYNPLTTESGYDYTYGEPLSEKASEAPSSVTDPESDPSEKVSDDEDTEEWKMKIVSSRSYLHVSPSASKPSGPLNQDKKIPFLESMPKEGNDTAKRILHEKLQARRNSGMLPHNYPRLSKPIGNQPPRFMPISETIAVPTLAVIEAHTPPITNNLPPSYAFTPSRNSLSPQYAVVSTKFKGQTRRIGPLKEPYSSSSGYETMTDAMSHGTSSVCSEEIRYKWRQVELKHLCQFPSRKRGRLDIDAEKQDPLSPNCLIPMKYEVSSDEDSGEESDTPSESSDTPRKQIQYDSRYYLNSTQFSSEYCSEFHYIGPRMGLPPSSINQAVVLGTTVRCAVDYGDQYGDPYFVTQSFTPAIHSKSWPAIYYYHFNQRMLKKRNAKDAEEQWPSSEQVEKIEKLGSNAIPLGFRCIQFFNTQQSLEWQCNFLQAESLLLNSFRGVHWRAYIFSSLIFRAFIAPLGPQGIGVEHIRNIIYFMCHEDFVGWNDEQPGVHLRAIITKLFERLGKGQMPNFFIQSQDLLKTIPSQNARLVQGHLSRLRDNLIIHCIYAFRNLVCVQPEESFYPTPDFKKLYNIITAQQEKELLRINNPGLAFTMTEEEVAKPGKGGRKGKAGKLDMIANADTIEGEFRTLIPVRMQEKDKMQARLRRRHIEWERKQRELAREQRSRNFSPDAKAPTPERRKSVDLRKSPVIQEKFSPLRKVLVIEFFIKHFLKMAEKSNEFRAYDQSTMYIMHVENLCEILLEGRYDLGQTTLDEETITQYKKQCARLRQLVGKEVQQYVLSRFSHLNLPTLTKRTNAIFGDWVAKSRAFHNNWDFRKLPTPPGSYADSGENEKTPPQSQLQQQDGRKMPVPQTKRLEAPNIAKTLQSIRPNGNVARRPPEPIKFVDRHDVAMKKKIASKQSIILINGDMPCESTDL